MKNKVDIFDDIDNTIHSVCGCISKLIQDPNYSENNEVAETTKALAELVSARASLSMYY